MNIDDWKAVTRFVALDKYPLLPCPYCHQIDLEFDESSIQSHPVSKNYEIVASRHYKLENERNQQKTEKNIKMAKDMIQSNSFVGFIGVVGLTLVESSKPNYHFCKFVAFMRCNWCNDNVAVMGLVQEHTKKPGDKKQLHPLYKIEHFSIPITMFQIHDYIPTSILTELYGAFSFFHIDTNSSAHKLRRAMEKFCEELNAKGNNLNRQINSLKNTEFSIEADLLDTLRLVGNEGTHSDGVDEDDLLAAFSIFEEVLTVFRRIGKLKELQVSKKALTTKFDAKKPK